ncbi:hypothetical protein B0H19DRAFT_1085065 [Mycena capillaripes]|nr:hypothetical protein B0H19DRAFT_1085065 [Mycena capillaripes]
MSSSTPPNATGSSSSPKKTRIKLSSQSSSDWIGPSLLAAKAITAGAECAPFPYIRGVFGLAVVILETVEKVKKNRQDLKEVCGDILEIIKIVRGQILVHGETAATTFKGLCEDLEGCLKEVLQAVEQLNNKPHNLRERFKEVIKLNDTADKIAGYQNRLRNLRLNFVVWRLNFRSKEVELNER